MSWTEMGMSDREQGRGLSLYTLFHSSRIHRGKGKRRGGPTGLRSQDHNDSIWTRLTEHPLNLFDISAEYEIWKQVQSTGQNDMLTLATFGGPDSWSDMTAQPSTMANGGDMMDLAEIEDYQRWDEMRWDETLCTIEEANSLSLQIGSMTARLGRSSRFHSHY